MAKAVGWYFVKYHKISNQTIQAGVLIEKDFAFVPKYLEGVSLLVSRVLKIERDK